MRLIEYDILLRPIIGSRSVRFAAVMMLLVLCPMGNPATRIFVYTCLLGQILLEFITEVPEQARCWGIKDDHQGITET